MRLYLREIGQGPKSSRDLSREEARDVMDLVLSAQATPAQVGGFLLIERFKGESASELLGFAEAIRARANLLNPCVEGLLDIGSPYDGRTRSLVISPAASIVAAAAGATILMHGEKDMPPKRGLAPGDVLEALGIDVGGQPEDVERSVEETGFGYLRSARFVPDLFALKRLREEVALRTAFNTIEKFYNPANAAYSLTGLTHVPYLEKMLEAITQMGFRRLIIIQGIEGTEDAPTSRPFRVFEINAGDVREYRLDARQFGLAPASPEDMRPLNASETARRLEDVLASGAGPLRDAVLFNAGIRIYLSERSVDVGKGIELANEALESGAALKKLQVLRSKAAARAA